MQKMVLEENLSEETANDIPEMTKEEQWKMRVFLALNHQDGKCHIYCDDGELQCNNLMRHGRLIDFRREKISDLLNIVTYTRLKEHNDRLYDQITPHDIEQMMKNRRNHER